MGAEVLSGEHQCVSGARFLRRPIPKAFERRQVGQRVVEVDEAGHGQAVALKRLHKAPCAGARQRNIACAPRVHEHGLNAMFRCCEPL